MDSTTDDIRAVEFTASRKGGSPVLPDLLDQIPPIEQIGTVTDDGAFDTRRCHAAILDRGGTAIFPIRRNARLWEEAYPAAKARNDILRASKRFGRANWKTWSGYHLRSRIEARMRCFKSFGERIASRDPDRQTAEVQIRVALMNRFNAPGTAEIERAG
ncbi:transposase (plasmid) [Paracoccus aminophilus JCM 7686]|uniref:Transposase n=1 Tax=Paracoccus aminophilus JCM 7686 TaxID=1367847 RepID=S5Y5Q9_PARAH|nr:transposase [Paracoccus aminophilus JCM 7686]